MTAISSMESLPKVEETELAFVNENTDEKFEEESPNSRKRGLSLKSGKENRGRKKQKDANDMDKQQPDGGGDNTKADADKENNGRPTSLNNSRHNRNNDPDTGAGNLVRRSINKKNKPAEAGVITRIYVENFMW